MQKKMSTEDNKFLMCNKWKRLNVCLQPKYNSKGKERQGENH